MIVLIACSRNKLSEFARARDLYISPLFRLCFDYAQSLGADAIRILSAKYGLVRPEQVLVPYDESLNTMDRAAVKAWAAGVLTQLRQEADLERDEFILLAGSRYRRFIEPELRHVKVPLKGLAIGKQLQYLKRALI